ncbi:hypothetical protein Syn7502_02295 [Synechococcus sp. PCC 7502]|uniref:hypothetical protein n=1 Tax=Synechococcus sp. PCC 7502 TaxID=1173263 RepID=UPI00029FA221|nr:hypothetical protein [Synechococcus sp. PCC 7502]AFY74298.1 hypothetical protein Syn7502_02295 [Synechococcus sp. PCC 7502]
MPTIYVAITDHGFGHATRTAAVVAEIEQQCPDISIIVATTSPRWLLESYLSKDFMLRHRAFDVGVVQADSIQVDKTATLAKVNQIRDRSKEIISAEVEFLKSHQVDLIFADTPPLVAGIATAAQIPCWMAGNFGWDFIYRDWGQDYAEITDWSAELYGQCDRLFRLPFYEPMTSFTKAHEHNQVFDVGLTGGFPRYTPEALRSLLGFKEQKFTVLLTFGGLSLNEIPYQNLALFPDWQFITFDRHAPDLPNLTKIQSQTLRPVDIMPICDRVFSKPGYSTLAEAYRTGVPFICITREGFLEAQTLIAGVQDYFEHLVISPDDFYQTNWEFLRDPLIPPLKAPNLDIHGEVAIAQAVKAFFS